MSDELIPSSPPSSFFEKLNLPEIVAGPAGKAISRLIAGAVEIPAAYLDGFAQSIKSKTEAKRLVANEVATAAAKLAAGDPNIVQRAVYNLLAKEYRHQTNKEEIAKKTIEILEHETAGSEQPQSGGTEVSSVLPEVDEDWLNIFEKYAEDASTERMQELWAHILAGEIRNPKTFSLKTLRFVSELDQETARLFEKYVPLVCNGSFLPAPQPMQGPEFVEMLHLNDAGLLTGASGGIAQTFQTQAGTPVGLVNQGRMLLIESQQGLLFQIQCALLTKIGIELLRIVKPSFNLDRLKDVVARIPKNGITNITMLGNPPNILWPEPAQQDMESITDSADHSSKP
jgi:hypothetical protein